MKNALYLSAILALVCAPAMAQNWDEIGDGGGDAGIQNAAQVTTGTSSLTTISGTLDQAGGDHVDCYVIQVTDVTTFYVTSDPAVDPAAVVGETDTRLWIFDGLGGAAISANDDSPGQAGFLSVVADPNLGPITYSAAPVNPVTTPLTDGTNYVICYSYYANDPEDAALLDLVPFGSAFEALNGPDPAAGAYDHWENTGTDAPAAYTIALAGAGTSDVPVELQSFSIE
jgi:hypothetical protein